MEKKMEYEMETRITVAYIRLCRKTTWIQGLPLEGYNMDLFKDDGKRKLLYNNRVYIGVI